MTNFNNNKKMHIAVLDFDDIRNPLLAAGQAKSTFEVFRHLAQKGHRITVVSSRFPGYKDRTEEGIEYRHIGIGSGNIRLNNAFYILSIPFAVWHLKADIVVECFTAPVSTIFSPLFAGAPVVARPTSFEAERFSKKYHLPFWIIEKFGCRFYKYFLPPTPSSEEKMKKFNPSIVSKIAPEGVGDEFFRINKKTPEHILFLGRLDIGQKGIDLLLEAYAKIEDKIKWPLVIAGNGPDEDKVKAMIKKLNLEHRVTMAGASYGAKKAELMSRSLFVALPSRHEGFSLFALEALAAGLPLAAFDIPGIRWTGRNTALKAKPFDIDEYAALLKKMAEDRNLVENMGRAARSFAERFAWKNVADIFEDFFIEIVSGEADARRRRLEKNL